MKTGRGGVKYVDLTIGDGPIAERGCEVEVRYDLFLNRGDRIQQDETASLRLGERSAIAGLEYGIEGMREGGSRRIRIGPHLAYKEVGAPGIVPQNAVLEFHVSLLRVVPPKDDVE